MPSTKKTIHFLSCALVTCIAVGLLGYGISADWARAHMQCARSNTGAFNGTATILYKLFNGTLNRDSCPNFGGSKDFYVFPTLTNIGGTALALHSLVLALLILCLVTSVATILISIYNSVTNPYETYMGPLGIYVSSCLSIFLSVSALVIFVLNVNFTNMAEATLGELTDNNPVFLKNKSVDMQLGYYLVIPYVVLCLVAIGVIYMYDHAAYTQRREQQKPTEDAPKEIMMY